MVMTYNAHYIKITRLVWNICEKAYQMTCIVIDIVSLFQVVNKLDRILLARDKWHSRIFMVNVECDSITYKKHSQFM